MNLEKQAGDAAENLVSVEYNRNRVLYKSSVSFPRVEILPYWAKVEGRIFERKALSDIRPGLPYLKGKEEYRN